MSEVHEITPNVYRISHWDQAMAPVEFSQFLIIDEKPLLFHTGAKSLFPETVEAVKSVIDPGKLAYISYSHLESDECGAMNQFLAAAPNAEIVHGTVGAMTGAGEFFDRPLRGLGDNDVLDLGEKKLRFLVTPHVPHAWDAILVFEDTTRTLFCSDLFTVFGKPPATTESDMIEQSMTTLQQLPGYLPVGPHTGQVFDRLIALEPEVIAGHHAAAYTGDAVRALQDLRGELFKWAGVAVDDIAEGSGESPEDAEPYG
jgi:flavorubredoxin